MLKSLLGLLAKTPGTSGTVSPQKPLNKMSAKVPAPAKDYRSVSVAPGIKCCAAAKAGVSKRVLFRDAPRLPLASCTMPTACSCKFKKASDRRDGDRREIGVTETGRWYTGLDHRKRGRRSAKD
jgi:hypothetical protein